MASIQGIPSSGVSTPIIDPKIENPTTEKTAAVGGALMKVISATAFALCAIGALASKICATAVPTGNIIPACITIGAVALSVLLIAIADPDSFKSTITDEERAAMDNSRREYNDDAAEDRDVSDKKGMNHTNAIEELRKAGEIHAPVGSRF
jgi:hypothetical protein